MRTEAHCVASELAIDLAGRIGIPNQADTELMSFLANPKFLAVHCKTLCGRNGVFEMNKEMSR